MSYCRWSSLSGFCDAYVYEDVHGGWVTHIAERRQAPGVLSDGSELFYAYPKGCEGHPVAEIWAQQNRLRSEQDIELIDIDHPEAGASFNHSTPNECADNLERLQREGFIIPNDVIQTLRQEGKEER